MILFEWLDCIDQENAEKIILSQMEIVYKKKVKFVDAAASEKVINNEEWNPQNSMVNNDISDFLKDQLSQIIQKQEESAKQNSIAFQYMGSELKQLQANMHYEDLMKQNKSQHQETLGMIQMCKAELTNEINDIDPKIQKLLVEQKQTISKVVSSNNQIISIREEMSKHQKDLLLYLEIFAEQKEKVNKEDLLKNLRYNQKQGALINNSEEEERKQLAQQIKEWNMENNLKFIQVSPSLKDFHNHCMRSMLVSKNLLFLDSDDKGIQVYNLNNNYQLFESYQLEQNKCCYCMLACKNYLAFAFVNNMIHICKNNQGFERMCQFKTKDLPYSLSQINQDKLMIGEYGGHLEIYSFSKKKIIFNTKLENSIYSICRIDQNKNQFAFGIDGGIYLATYSNDALNINTNSPYSSKDDQIRCVFEYNSIIFGSNWTQNCIELFDKTDLNTKLNSLKYANWTKPNDMILLENFKIALVRFKEAIAILSLSSPQYLYPLLKFSPYYTFRQCYSMNLQDIGDEEIKLIVSIYQNETTSIKEITISQALASSLQYL